MPAWNLHILSLHLLLLPEKKSKLLATLEIEYTIFVVPIIILWSNYIKYCLLWLLQLHYVLNYVTYLSKFISTKKRKVICQRITILGNVENLPPPQQKKTTCKIRTGIVKCLLSSSEHGIH